ncbi:MAG: hypothetical protein G8237_10050 [Magnetococcales bacterium]|nr:hypothetical protein [Magnetococcales bacterium]NGZ06686.1 hypothetical protein [Magnetococcales bacterium]
MGQYTTIRIPPSRDGFNDLEPEYQEMWDWFCPTSDHGDPHGMPLSWRAMIAAHQMQRTHPLRGR